MFIFFSFNFLFIYVFTYRLTLQNLKDIVTEKGDKKFPLLLPYLLFILFFGEKTNSPVVIRYTFYIRIKIYRATTDSKHSHPVAVNHLNRNFKEDKANKFWVADITYISTQEGWLYLSTIMDLYSRKIVGCSMKKWITKELVIEALNMAIKQRKPERDLLLHSDRGSQYASYCY